MGAERRQAGELHRLADAVWEIPAAARPDMRVPARVFADEELLDAILGDRSLEQLQNVATLPGVTDAVLAMPDVHQGYGFPVGGVAAMETPDGVISPGGVGYDINCGVRLLALPVTDAELGGRRADLVHQISRAVPAGMGKSGALSLDDAELDHVLVEGARAVVERHGLGTAADLERTESGGRLEGADPSQVSERARVRGGSQLGTMGAGNHFIEVQRVDRVLDPAAAEAFGLRMGQVTVLIHSGSRGFGHQVCSDYVRTMDRALKGYGIVLPDRQLACAPLSSPEGKAYLGAMSCAANFAWANRQTMAQRVREAVAAAIGQEAALGTRQVYDVAHNVAKLERHGGRTLCVHRKGATRAFPPGSDEIPGAYREAGQPVFIPGSMGTASYVLAGRPGSMEHSFGSCCHGAGRRMSRTGARRRITGAELRRELEEAGIVVRCPSARGLAEEAPFAYKDVHRVVSVVERAGLAAAVARLTPLGVVKG
ncbi:MAG TPA: RtcB family protein [Solirubrobacterales bacterium]|nr:RtcB family protein [Solirubrobacterales bacterium]